MPKSIYFGNDSMISIKAKVTIWYTFSIMLISTIVVVFFVSFSEQISRKELKERLIDVVTDAIQNIEFSYEELKSDIDLYNDGVSIFIYDTKGYLIIPRINQGIQINSILEDNTVKIVDSMGEKWIVYDVFAEKNDTNFWIRGVISISKTKQNMKDIKLIVFTILPIFIFITAFGGFKITKKTFEPIKKIADTASAINSGNDLSSRIDMKNLSPNDEIFYLVNTMNNMLSRLQNSFNNEKQFTSDVSHELRTPIAVIISQCEYALSDDSSDKDKYEALNTILKKSKIMSDMVSQLLMFVRAENGNFTPRIENNNLSILSEMILLDLECMISENNIKLESDILPDVFVMCDEILMARLITNLLTNAVRYNKKEGSIKFYLNKDDKYVIISVSDTGIGIKKEDLEKIWKRFYRVDYSRTGESTGLGLSMVEWIADVHNGFVEVESIFNIGSKFTVKIPLLA